MSVDSGSVDDPIQETTSPQLRPGAGTPGLIFYIGSDS